MNYHKVPVLLKRATWLQITMILFLKNDQDTFCKDSPSLVSKVHKNET